MTREEIEQKMDELAHKYVETHEKKSQKSSTSWPLSLRIYKLTLEPEKIETGKG
jgi:hypothetical protein